MSPGFLTYKSSRIAFYQFGSGSRPVICFHGYGENGSSFEFLPDFADPQFRFYAIDLPFHGKTEWNEGLLFTEEDLVSIVEQITGNPSQALLVMGFSLGGRMALSLYQVIPGKVDKLILLAPDGLKVNFWYWLSTRTWFGSKLFKFTMEHPGWFFAILKGFHKIRLVNPSIFKFVNQYIGDKQVRLELYERWISLRKIRPDLPKIKEQIREHKTPVHLFYGKHDRIILSSVGEKFRKGIEEHCDLTILLSGHQVLHERHAGKIVAALDS
jgi:pimeloyl-ACP methyl ester carboxylesterase